MTNSHKLGVIVPYRGRYQHLLEFKQHIQRYLTSKEIEFELIIIEQDGAKTFNRGKLLNVGYFIAKKLKCDYVVFHDVDMLPIDVDYSYSDVPIHLATNFLPKSINRIIFDEYFGGVTLFPIETFEVINGYSNEYWGWGYEDNDLLHRCKINRIGLDRKEIKMMGGNTAALKFNGTDSYVKFKNNIDINKPLTFFVTFYPDDIVCNPEKYDDVYEVFSIPNIGLQISYNSYKRYNFVTYDSNKEYIFINSNIKTNYKTNICVTLDPVKKLISMYQDGEMIGTKEYEATLYDFEGQNFMYLGKNYSGLINSFAMFDKILPEIEIVSISENQFFGLTQNFGRYKSSDSLMLYYDAKCVKNRALKDLSGDNDGEITHCKTVGYTFDSIKTLDVPYRRNCTFKLLTHEENGYVGSGWKDITTRYNQLRYHNEVYSGSKNTKHDGLSNCEFKIRSNANVDNETHIVVEI